MPNWVFVSPPKPSSNYRELRRFRAEGEGFRVQGLGLLQPNKDCRAHVKRVILQVGFGGVESRISCVDGCWASLQHEYRVRRTVIVSPCSRSCTNPLWSIGPVD